MVLRWTLLSTLLLATLALSEKRSYDTHSYYVLRHNPSASFPASLADVVDALDVELVEQVGELRDHWLVKRRKPESVLVAREDSDPVLSQFESLKAKAASPVMQRSENVDIARRVVSSVEYLSLQTLRRRAKRAPPPALPPQSEPQSKSVANRLGIQDPLFPKQWHLINDEFPQYMMNVTGVWEMGLTGKGIISSFIDDGLDYTSEDLISNFVSHLVFLGTLSCNFLQGRRRLLRL
jgi:kexin